MRIGMILPSGFPPDIRVEKEVGTLAGEHEMFLLCPRRGQQLVSENWQGMQVHRVFSRGQRWWSQWSLMARQRSHLWEAAIEKYVLSINADALHVHDLPLLGPALKVTGRLQIPLVADLHENYPAMLEDARKTPLHQIASLGSLVSRLSVSIPKWRAYEELVVPQVQRIIVVVEEARERLVQLGVDADTITVVGNYATLDETDKRVRPGDSTSQDMTQTMSAVYAGGFDGTRDLATVLHAVKALPDQTRSAVSVKLIGGQGKDLVQLQSLALDLGIEEHVSLLEWLPRPEAEQLLSEADVGLVPHIKSAHTDATIPHKLFQYMWRRLPVIVSDCAPLERIVREADCGLVYKTGDSQALAQCLSDMYDRKNRTATFGEAGHLAVARKYNWDRAGESLLQLYRDIR